MWQVVSSEKPARPRLALLVISLAFGGSLGAAWMYCRDHQIPLADFDQRPAYWPIRFQLPNHLKWVLTNVDIPALAPEDADRGRIGFVGIEPGRGRYELILTYNASSPGHGKDEPATLQAAPTLTKLDKIEVGPLDGRLYARETMTSISLLARAWTDDGMMIEIEISTVYYSPHAMSVMREVCGSIQYQDWWLPRPELWPVNYAGEASEVTS